MYKLEIHNKGSGSVKGIEIVEVPTAAEALDRACWWSERDYLVAIQKPRVFALPDRTATLQPV